MAIVTKYTCEKELITKSQNEIHEFWQTGQFHSFDGVDDITIKCATFVDKQHHKNLVIVQGRSESYIKYKELAYDLFQQGFNIFLLDHRGQGLSGRMLANPHKGYVNSFDDYAEDLHTFISIHVMPFCDNNTKPFILAHSMGCAITSLFLARYSKLIQAVVFSSPMFAINTGGIPRNVASGLLFTLRATEKLFTKSAWYFPGQGNHYFKPFDKNLLSHSESRYHIFKELYQKETEVQLGGVTIKWLKLAHQIKRKIFAIIPEIHVPILVLQAGSEKIVDNAAQDEFCQLFQKTHKNHYDNQLVVIENAWHELFFEKDEYRNQALDQCLAWFNKH